MVSGVLLYTWAAKAKKQKQWNDFWKDDWNLYTPHTSIIVIIQYADLNPPPRVGSHLHEADAAGQEVHEKGEEGGHVVDLRRLGDAAQRL